MLYLGSDTPAFLGYGYELDGMLDEVCIFNTSLASEDISALHELTDCSSFTTQQEEEEEEEEDSGRPDTGDPEPEAEPEADSVPETEPEEPPESVEDEDAVDGDNSKVDIKPGCSHSVDFHPSGGLFLLLIIGTLRRKQSLFLKPFDG